MVAVRPPAQQGAKTVPSSTRMTTTMTRDNLLIQLKIEQSQEKIRHEFIDFPIWASTLNIPLTHYTVNFTVSPICFVKILVSPEWAPI